MMEVEVIEQEDDKLVLQIPKKDVTIANLIRDELWNDENVSEAANTSEHPYLSEPRIFVKTSRGKPETALAKACERLLSKLEQFSEGFKKAEK